MSFPNFPNTTKRTNAQNIGVERTTIHSCTGAQLKDLGTDHGELICLIKPSLRSIRRLFVAYCCYHKLRHENREEIDTAVRADDFEPMIDLLCAYARIVAGEHPWYLC